MPRVKKNTKKSAFALKLESLSASAIDSRSVLIDWEARRGENLDGWTSYEANRCDKCGLPVVILSNGMGGEEHKDCGGVNPEDCPECGGALGETSMAAHGIVIPPGVAPTDDDLVPALICFDCDHKIVNVEKCDGHVSQAEGPVMNYYYPVEISDCERAAIALARLPLCVVKFEDDDRTALALTGGGMDFSWEICEAFIAIGELPPLFATDLPGMAGKRLDAKSRLIVAACIESNKVMAQRAESNIKRIKETVARMRRDEREDKVREAKAKSKVKAKRK